MPPEDVDLVVAGAIPLLVADVLEPAGVRRRGEVEQRAGPAELPNARPASAWQPTGPVRWRSLPGDHLCTSAADQFDGGLRRAGARVAAGYQRAFAGKDESRRAADAPAPCT
jgi:hypothetical protein